MSDIKLTDELKQMNRYYRLLCGLVNESMGVLNSEGLSPEERLERLREKLEFVRRYLKFMPASARTELDADPRVQATMAHIRHQMNDPQAANMAATWIRGEDGDFHEAPSDYELGEQRQSDRQV